MDKSCRCRFLTVKRIFSQSWHDVREFAINRDVCPEALSFRLRCSHGCNRRGLVLGQHGPQDCGISCWPRATRASAQTGYAGADDEPNDEREIAADCRPNQNGRSATWTAESAQGTCRLGFVLPPKLVFPADGEFCFGVEPRARRRNCAPLRETAEISNGWATARTRW